MEAMQNDHGKSCTAIFENMQSHFLQCTEYSSADPGAGTELRDSPQRLASTSSFDPLENPLTVEHKHLLSGQNSFDI